MTSGATVRAGALSLLAACFFASGLLRAGDVVAALPKDGKAPDRIRAEAPEQAAPMSADAIVGLADELKRQRAALARREAALEEREQLLEGIEARVRERLAELEAVRQRLARAAALVDGAAEKDVARLAEMYRRMKPKEAARIFDAMAPKFAAGFLAEIGPNDAAPILAGMAPEKAYAVSLLLAGRNIGRE